MLKEQFHILRRLNIITDALIAALSFWLSMFVSALIETGSFSIPSYYFRFIWLFYVVIVLWPLLLNLNGLYPTNRLRLTKQTIFIILRSSLQGFVIVLGVLFIFKMHFMSRLMVAEFVVLVTLQLILKELFFGYYFRRLRASGANLRNLLIVGSVEAAGAIIADLDKDTFYGLHVVGLLVPQNQMGHKEMLGKKVLGGLKDIEVVLHTHPTDTVIVTLDRSDYKEVDDIISSCEEEGVEIWLRASFMHSAIAKLDVGEFFGAPIFRLVSGPRFSWSILIKYSLDRFSGFFWGLVTLPILIIAAISIKVTSRGPVIFKQKRCGLHGRTFTLYKLRTMYADAEERKESLEHANILKGPVFKLNQDPRITPVGRILRKLSIDEIPQFWNVLKGDMSLVGPRPPLPKEIQNYKRWHRRRLSMKPGITGLWQVSGRTLIDDFDKWAELDLKYIDSWSLWLDMWILLKTVPVVLSTVGAK